MPDTGCKRKAGSEDAAVISDNATRTTKKPKPVDDLTCAITWELPVDPVFAEDGRVYERYDIEKHIKIKEDLGHAVTSPMTSEPMGTKLVAAIQHKNVIGTLVEDGSITGELADKWKERSKLTQVGLKWLREADDGDADSMYNVAMCHFDGHRGFTKDLNLFFEWMMKAHEAGDVCATASIGKAYFFGQGCEKCNSLGMIYTAMAAGKGSDMASYYLGMSLANGWFNWPVNEAEAIKWLQTCVDGNCIHLQLADEYIERAKTRLQQLKGRPTNLVNETVVGSSLDPVVVD